MAGLNEQSGTGHRVGAGNIPLMDSILTSMPCVLYKLLKQKVWLPAVDPNHDSRLTCPTSLQFLSMGD
jgi:hypothetical protein